MLVSFGRSGVVDDEVGADPIAVARLPSLASLPPAMSGKISIELPSGIKLSVDAPVDAEALGRVLSVLER